MQRRDPATPATTPSAGGAAVNLTSGGMLGLVLMVLGAILAVLILLWLASYVAAGTLHIGGALFGVIFLVLLCLPMIGAGWYLRGQGRAVAAESAQFAARRDALDNDVLVRRQLVREIEQRLAGIERLVPSLPATRATAARAAVRRLRDLREELSRPGYDAAMWLDRSNTVTPAKLASVRQYDDLVLQEAQRLGTLEDALPTDPAAADRLVQSVDSLASHVREREQLFSLGREAGPMRPQELLAAGRELRRPEVGPLTLAIGDSLSYNGDDYLTRAVISYFTGGRRWQAYQLNDGKQERWLEVRADGTSLVWLTPRSALDQATGSTVALDGMDYSLVENGTATVSIESAAGSQDGVPVEYYRYTANHDVLLMERWPDGPRTLTGEPVMREELEVWARTPASS